MSVFAAAGPWQSGLRTSPANMAPPCTGRCPPRSTCSMPPIRRRRAALGWPPGQPRIDNRPPVRYPGAARKPVTASERETAMPMTPQVRKILSWYESDNPGTKNNLARILMHGKLGGSGRVVILPVDQGFEHGPDRSFAPNPDAFDPHYHYQLAVDAGL